MLVYHIVGNFADVNDDDDGGVGGFVGHSFVGFQDEAVW